LQYTSVAENYTVADILVYIWVGYIAISIVRGRQKPSLNFLTWGANWCWFIITWVWTPFRTIHLAGLSLYLDTLQKHNTVFRGICINFFYSDHVLQTPAATLYRFQRVVRKRSLSLSLSLFLSFFRQTSSICPTIYCQYILVLSHYLRILTLLRISPLDGSVLTDVIAYVLYIIDCHLLILVFIINISAVVEDDLNHRIA